MQGQARGDVDAERERWRQENQKIQDDCATQSEAKRKEVDQQVTEKAANADKEADQKLTEAETNAEEERKKAEAKAAEEKRKEEHKPRSWWQRVKGAISSVLNAIKKVVNAIFDGLRALVKGIFELAKKLVRGIIELARMAIVGLIKAFGALLKGLVTLALAAFPEAAKKARAWIDKRVDQAVSAVNKAAEALKKATDAILDFVGEVLDTALSVVQKIYNVILDVVQFLVVGLVEIVERIAYLVSGAKKMPDHFEGAAWEELLGMDISKPLPIEAAAGVGAPAGAESEAHDLAPVSGGSENNAAARALPEKNEYSAGDFAVEPVAELEPSAELEEILPKEEGEEVDLGKTDEPVVGLDALRAQALVPTPESPTEVTQTKSPAPFTSLPEPSRAGRAKWIWEQMKQVIADWFDKNWWKLLLGLTAAILGVILLNILTGGAIMLALPILLPIVLEVFTIVMVGIALARIGGHLKDYLVKGWDKDDDGAGKSLAKGLAIGAIEIAFALGFRVIGAALKIAAKGVKLAAKGVAKVAKAGAGLAANVARTVVKGGKFVFQGLARGFLKGIKSLRDLASRLFKSFRVRGLKLRRSGLWVYIIAIINPEFIVARIKVNVLTKTWKEIKTVASRTQQKFMHRVGTVWEKIAAKPTKAKEVVDSVAGRLAAEKAGTYGRPDNIKVDPSGLIKEVEEVKYFGADTLDDLGKLAQKDPGEFVRAGLGEGKFIQIVKHKATADAIAANRELIEGTVVKGVASEVKYVVTLPKFAGSSKKAVDAAVEEMKRAWKSVLGIDVAVQYGSHTTKQVQKVVKALEKVK